MHHVMVIQSLTQVLRSLGIKGVPFLPHPKGATGPAYHEAVRKSNAELGWALCPALGASRPGQPQQRPIIWTDAENYPWA